MKNWLIYGTGKTGILIAQEALRRGHTPLLVGRSAERVKPAAKALGLNWATADLGDEAGLANFLNQVDLVVHTAGPFSYTSLPMIRACMKLGKDYLDISNEIPVFQSIFKLDEEARRRGIALIPGVGFGVTATEGLAKHVTNQVKDAQELEIAIHIYSNNSSAGADATRLEALSRGVWARRNGTLKQVPFGSGGKRLKFPFGEQTILPIPLGDLESTFRSTRVPDITTYGTVPVSATVARIFLPVVEKIVSIAGVRSRLEQIITKKSNASNQRPAVQGAHSYTWARAKNNHGDVFEAWQEMGEGYDFTAQSAVYAVEKVLNEPLVGALTPTQAFGADFALLVAGTKRYTPTKG
jgi:short subunit dehydrogenase-like uncharacterized protein